MGLTKHKFANSASNVDNAGQHVRDERKDAANEVNGGSDDAVHQRVGRVEDGGEELEDGGDEVADGGRDSHDGGVAVVPFRSLE